MSKYIWAVTAPLSNDNDIGFSTFEAVSSGKSLIKEEIEFNHRNSFGEVFPAEAFPDKLQYRPSLRQMFKKEFDKKLPPFCNVHPAYVVTEELAQVLRGYDMGIASLYPVKMYLSDGETEIDETVYFLNIGNKKQTVDLDKSENYEWDSPFPKPVKMRPNLILEDDDTIVHADCLEGPDIWADPNIVKMFFLSERLAKALMGLKMKKILRLRRCKLG